MSPDAPVTVDLGDFGGRWDYVSGRYRMVDLDFGIKSEDAPTARFLDRMLAPFRVPGKPATWYSFRHLHDERNRIVVRAGEKRVLMPGPDRLVGSFLWHLNQRVMVGTRSHLTIHAGVVALDGHGVVIPGDANAGKSTLVAALVHDGFDYLSDEAALVHLDGPVISSYRRWMALEPGSWPLLPHLAPEPDPGYDQSRQWLIPASDVQPAPSVDRCVPTAIVFPRVVPGIPADLRPLSRAGTVRELSRNAPNLADLGVPGFHALVGAVTATTCWELQLDGLDAAVAAIRHLVTKGA